MNVKKLAQMIAGLRAVPVRLNYRIACKIMGPTRALASLSEQLGAGTGMMGLYLRQACYRHVLEHVGKDVYLGYMTQFSKTAARIGDRVYIGRFCTLGSVVIENDVMLADSVQLLSGRHQHGNTSPSGLLRDNEQTYQTITIGCGAWVGANAVVMADVGAGAIVGAGAVVTKPVAPGDRVAGVPARSIIKPVFTKAG